MTQFFNRISKPSLRYGVIFGLILGAIEIVLWVINFIVQYFFPQTYIAQYSSIQPILNILSLGAFLVVGYMASQKTARETGKFIKGIVASLWAGLIGCVLELLIPLVIDLIYLPTSVAADQQDYKMNPSNWPGMKLSDITPMYVLTIIAAYLLLSIFINTLIALVGGLLGGALGRRRTLAYEAEEGSVPQAEETAEAGQVGEAGDSV